MAQCSEMEKSYGQISSESESKFPIPPGTIQLFNKVVTRSTIFVGPPGTINDLHPSVNGSNFHNFLCSFNTDHFLLRNFLQRKTATASQDNSVQWLHSASCPPAQSLHSQDSRLQAWCQHKPGILFPK